MNSSLLTATLLCLGSMTAHAASFDCTQAKQPAEKLICSVPDLSKIDGEMGVLYKKNLEVLSPHAVQWVKESQKEWLAYWPSLCVNEVGKIDPLSETTLRCAKGEYQTRISILNRQKRLANGLITYPVSHYRVMKSTAGVEFVKLAHHSENRMAIDIDQAPADQKAQAIALNTWLDASQGLNATGEGEGDDETINDTEVDEALIASAQSQILSLRRSTYLYGHGAAHPVSTALQRHYNLNIQAPLTAQQVFSSPDFGEPLGHLVEKALKKLLKENYAVDKFETLKALVIQPDHWTFDAKGLIVSFDPYEVAPYVAGAPEVSLPWTALKDLLDPQFAAGLPKPKAKR
jgi:uncharacterized protein YecT (DUF1311 family)